MKYKISLRISDEDLDPSAITSILSIEPTISYKKGDINSKIKKNGHMSTLKSGTWILDISSEENEDFDYHLKLLLDQLKPGWEKLIELKKKGYKIDIFCGIFSANGEQTGIEISASTIKRIDDLNIPIGICFYHL